MRTPPDDAEFGPRGYLPPRAARRARKIVLREQMGIHWPIAAVVAGVLILLITVPIVIAQQGPPGPPAVPAGPLSAIPADGDATVDAGGVPVLVVRAGGSLRGFVDPPPGARWCPASRRIEAPDGTVWTADGRLMAGAGTSLAPASAVQAYDGRLYVDATPLAAPAARPADVTAACTG